MMAGRGTSHGNAAGGPARHIPVLLNEVIGVLAPHAGGIYIDGTFGAGGYTRAILEAAECRVLAIDRDPTAIAAGQVLADAYRARLTLARGRFSELDTITESAGIEAADGVALDVGVSSIQLDDADRGFSFMRDGPLDMRMGGEGPTAADVVNGMGETDLARIIYVLGDERRSRAIARAICGARGPAGITTTKALADVVAGAVGPSREQKHPATRTFQALRIYVNSELRELAEGLSAAERTLRPGGRLAVVSFHSLEDRLVKRFLAERSRTPGTSRHLPEARAEAPTFRPVTRQAIAPSDAEVEVNARARSAKLRGAERTDAPARALDMAALGVARLPVYSGPSGRLQ